MAITATHVTSYMSGATQSSYTTSDSSMTLPDNNLGLVSVVSQRSVANPAIPTLTGLGRTWVQVATLQETTNSTRRVTLFRAMGLSSSTGALTANFGGQNQIACAIFYSYFAGVQATGSNGADAVIQSATNQISGTSTGLTVTLPSAFVGSGNATFGVTFNNQSTSGIIAPGSGFTELGENWGALLDVQHQWKNTPDTIVDWTWSSQSVIAVGIAVEIRHALATVTTTSPATDITSNSADGAGNVTNNGGGTVSERGVAWGTAPNPTISGSHQSSGSGTGAFGPVTMAALIAATHYYFRAYVINDGGVSYGSDVQFDTLDAVISGVCALSGAPVENAKITLIDSDTDAVVGTEMTDSSGEYGFGGLDVDKTYHVIAEYEDSPDQFNTKSLPFMTPEEV